MFVDRFVVYRCVGGRLGVLQQQALPGHTSQLDAGDKNEHGDDIPVPYFGEGRRCAQNQSTSELRILQSTNRRDSSWRGCPDCTVATACHRCHQGVDSSRVPAAALYSWSRERRHRSAKLPASKASLKEPNMIGPTTTIS